MCGICGKINLDSKAVDQGLIRKMAGVLAHRGPDDQGIYIKDNVGLGHRRLSIIDLSAAAHQPMSNRDGTVWIVYNGEIYNFLELRKDLEERGRVFRSQSDTEVILALYEEKGVDCVKYLRGMFAFAIWDQKKKRLFLARDRVGKKPLVYAFGDNSFIFASEIESILQDPCCTKEIGPQALDLYLTYQYIPAPQTIFKDIKKLPPAHTLVLEGGNIKIERYWELSFENTQRLEEQECAKKILDIFTQACKIRLRSDVPLGAFLSGGVDSSAVVAMMSRLSSSPVKTFSIGFTESSYNELQYARRIADIFGTEHHEYIVRPNALKVLPELIRHFGEPFADSSVIPTYYVSKMTRQEVAVALNGDGGDEAFGGYERYAANRMAGIYNYLPLFLRKGANYLFRGIPESTRKKDFIKYLKRFLKGGALSPQDRYASWMMAFDAGIKDDLYSSEFKSRLGHVDSGDYISKVYKDAGISDPVSAGQFTDILTYLPGDLLPKVDIASMASSLEARSPFLDHQLLEFAATIPSNLKIKGAINKYILKEAFKDILPADILKRRKYGFGVPVGDWFKAELKGYAYDLLLSQACLRRGYFRGSAVKNVLDAHMRGKSDHGQRIWGLINLELWHQIFID